ncbi:MAG TPA: hypothetical protein VME43_13895 [Bryobacteraceae bacterium]|nr:hypothetical protein [Bryobacteraceae bacterium]
MKLAVSYDDHGEIQTLFDPDSLRGDKLTLTYVPAPGEKHQVMEVPAHLAHKPLMELPALLRVTGSGAHAKLVAR